MGCLHEEGEGVLRSGPEAVRWFKEAAASGEGRLRVDAECALGLLYVKLLGGVTGEVGHRLGATTCTS